MHNPMIVAGTVMALLLAGCDAADGTDTASPAASTPANVTTPTPADASAAVPSTLKAGPADIVRHYYALIGEHRYGEAWALWSDDGKASNETAEAFAASFADIRRYDAVVGDPGPIEGAAGSLYATVPVEVTGEKADGTPIHIKGNVTLRRVNDVPGSTAEQRQWHISGVPG